MVIIFIMVQGLLLSGTPDGVYFEFATYPLTFQLTLSLKAMGKKMKLIQNLVYLKERNTKYVIPKSVQHAHCQAA